MLEYNKEHLQTDVCNIRLCKVVLWAVVIFNTQAITQYIETCNGTERLQKREETQQKFAPQLRLTLLPIYIVFCFLLVVLLVNFSVTLLADLSEIEAPDLHV